MPCRSKKVQFNKKKRNSALITGTDHLIQLNMNASNKIENHLISHLESIGHSIIDEVTGSERDHFKEQLLQSYAKNFNANHNISYSASRTSLNQILNDLHASHIHRDYCAIATTNNDDEGPNNRTTSQSDITTMEQIHDTNLSNNESRIQTAIKRSKKQTKPSITRQKSKNLSNIPTRTICTRSSKLNNLNNNEELSNDIFTRKRRSSMVDTTRMPSETNLSMPKSVVGNDVCGVKISRKKLQSSVPSIECPTTTNDF